MSLFGDLWVGEENGCGCVWLWWGNKIYWWEMLFSLSYDYVFNDW